MYIDGYLVFLGSQWRSHGIPRNSKDISGLSWISKFPGIPGGNMVSPGYPWMSGFPGIPSWSWISIDVLGIPWPHPLRSEEAHVFMDIHGYTWLSMDIFGITGKPDIHVYPCIFQVSDGIPWDARTPRYPWISMEIYDRLGIPGLPNIHGCPWISMDIHGYPCIPMDIHGYPWITLNIPRYGRPSSR